MSIGWNRPFRAARERAGAGLKRLSVGHAGQPGHTFPSKLKVLERIALRPGGEAGKERRLEGHPDTNGRAGGKLPAGKGALRSSCRSFSAACRKADTNQA
jgi:hypothetical protein